MKQHITCDQYEEIGSKKMIKTFGDDGYGFSDITIGRMIEFLDETKQYQFITKIDCCGTSTWSVNTMVCNSDKQHSQQLCDALWEACKEILNK